MKEGYLIIDVGTGNVRVAVCSDAGTILSVERDDVQYEKDPLYPDALHFDPDRLWSQIEVLIQKALQQCAGITILATTASSQREGVVLLDGEGKGIIGFPNHDHRGRQWQDALEDKHTVYQLTGRYPSSLFSAQKLVGFRHKRGEAFARVRRMLSISDWVQFQLSGVAVYEHAQASETQLYDVEQKAWSPYLCSLFNLDISLLPPLAASGTIIGTVLPRLAERFGFRGEVPVVVGGADTQLAIKSTGAQVGDVVIVSGTTTPVVKIISEYITDTAYRTWTNRYVDDTYMVLETNAGITGLNYQRLRKIFYPTESYEVAEAEMEGAAAVVSASLGSLVADEKDTLAKGGFFFEIPVAADLSRASFMKAALWEAASCIAENYRILQEVSPHNQDFVWACGGGFQSATLRNFITTLIGKPLRIAEGYHQASVSGAAIICSEAVNRRYTEERKWETVMPADADHRVQYQVWKETREKLKDQQTPMSA